MFQIYERIFYSMKSIIYNAALDQVSMSISHVKVSSKIQKGLIMQGSK